MIITTAKARPTLNQRRTKKPKTTISLHSCVFENRHAHLAALAAERFFIAVEAAGRSRSRRRGKNI